MSVAACGSPAVEGTESELGSSEAAICSWGYFTCPGQTGVWTYYSAAPICHEVGDPLHDDAEAECDEYCTATCVDSGWLDP